MGKLAINNEDLRQLLSSSERHVQHRRLRRAPNTDTRIRVQTCALYNFLSTGWRCQCPESVPSHQPSLLLEKRVGNFYPKPRAKGTYCFGGTDFKMQRLYAARPSEG
jgi:hypothetical protein